MAPCFGVPYANFVHSAGAVMVVPSALIASRLV
jgi:hypothetical protein